MITATPCSRPPTPIRWQTEMPQAITSPDALIEALGLDPALAGAAREAAAKVPLRVPAGYVARMRKGDPNDPLLLQVLPLGVENEASPGYGPDPVGEQA